MKRLKTWQKYAFWFGFVHLIISLVLNNFKFFSTGEANLASLFALIFDLPLLLLVSVFPDLLENDWFYKLFFPIAGTIMYIFIGTLVGLFVQELKRSKNK